MQISTAIVTGGAGFIGSHVVDALLDRGARVVVVDDLSTGESGRVSDRATLEVIDITDAAALHRVVDTVRPDAVFHLAAQSSVTVSVADPLRDCEVNVMGTLNLLQACRPHRIPITFTSTGGALYGNEAPLPTPEEARPAPISPYGASKWAGEAYLSTWAAADGVGHAICRLGNVYGPRQSPHGEAGVVAILSYQLWRGERPTLFGFGKPTRDYVHVTDVAGGLIAAAGHRGWFNIATGTAVAVKEVFDLLHAAVAPAEPIEPILAPLREGELERSCMDPTRAERELGWTPAIPLADGIRSTCDALLSGFAA
jgi:UDP-glucose 4-epimerase